MAWLQQSPAASTGRHILTHIDRLKALRAIALPDEIERAVHRNRLLKIAREGAQMTSRNLAKFEPERRHATLAAMVIETTATITDELIDLHDPVTHRGLQSRQAQTRERIHAVGQSDQ